MSSLDKKNLFGSYGAVFIAITALCICGRSYGSVLTIPNTFSSGSTISSSQMNGNFSAVKAANDDNNSRITNLENRQITVVNFSGGNNGYNTSTTAAQYTYISPSNLAFTKNSATSTILVTWNDALIGHALFAGLGFCNWDLRIDGTGNTTSLLTMFYSTVTDVTTPISYTATYTGLAAGAHNVQLWLTTNNAGCFNNAGGWTRSVTIQEIP